MSSKEDDGEEGELSMADLREYITHLESQLHEKDETIADLSKSQAGRGRGRGQRDVTQYEDEIAQLKEKVQTDSRNAAKLNEKIGELTKQVSDLTKDKAEQDRKIRSQTTQINDLDRQLAEAVKRSEAVTSQHKVVAQQKTATSQMTKQLMDENTLIKKENQDLQDQIKELENDKLSMSEIIAKYADEKDAVEAHRDRLDVGQEELQQELIQLENELHEAGQNLQESIEKEQESERKYADLQRELQSIKQKHSGELSKSVAQSQDLSKQLKAIKETSEIGKLQKEIEKHQSEHTKKDQDFKDLVEHVESLQIERDELAQKVHDLEENIDLRVQERIQNEKGKGKILEKTLQSQKALHAADMEHYAAVEKEKDALQKMNDELTHWKAVYEQGNGLQQLSRQLKKSNDDNRRLTSALEQSNIKYSKLLDAHNALLFGFDKLVKDTKTKNNGKDYFHYTEDGLTNLHSGNEEELMGNMAGLKLTLTEMEKQVQSLEEDNQKLRKQVVSNMGTMTEKGGYKYPGMTADMLMKVNEFAANLRDGKVELPLDNKSRELMIENKKLKVDLMSMNNQLLGFEQSIADGRLVPAASLTVGPDMEDGDRDGQAALPGQGAAGQGSHHHAGKHSEEMKILLQENANMHHIFNELRGQLDAILQQQQQGGPIGTPRGMIKASDLEAILAQNNELILKELESLRRSTQGLLPGGGGDGIAATGGGHIQPIAGARLRPFSAGAGGSRPPTAAGASAAYGGAYAAAAGTPCRRIGIAGMHQTPLRDSDKLTLGGGMMTPGNQGMQLPPSTAEGGGGGQGGGGQGGGMYYHQYWTPNMQRGGGMPFANSAAAPSTYGPGPATGGAGFSNSMHLGIPATPSGRQLLQDSIHSFNLPPEEWTMEVKDLYAQLVECLEQLFAREYENEQQASLLSQYETQMVEMKQQMLVLYHDYQLTQQTWQRKEEVMKQESLQIIHAKDDLQLKVKRYQEMHDLLQQQALANHPNEDSLTSKLQELTRKVVIYEVNEAILSRKYTALDESYQQEMASRMTLQADFTEMERTCKERILFLETITDRLRTANAQLNLKLEKCIPAEDYAALAKEMDCLREDHLVTLRREVEARTAALQVFDYARELRSLRLLHSSQRIDLEKTQHRVLSLEKELLHQIELGNKAMVAMKSTAEVASLVSDMARYRGEASRLEIEVMAATQRQETVSIHLSAVLQEIDALSKRVQELEKREEEYIHKEKTARQELVNLQLLYQDGGLTKEQADRLTLQFEKVTSELASSQLEVHRQKELAEIASEQASALQSHQGNAQQEMKELRAYCAKLEARSEDEVIIGRLERQLLSMKASYKAFTRKYQTTRENIRRREIAMRLLEKKILEEEEKSSMQSDRHQKDILVLKKALHSIQENIVQIEYTHHIATSDSSSSMAAATTAVGSSSAAQHVSRGVKYLTYGLGTKMVDISEKVTSLASLAENAVSKSAQKEEEIRRLQGQYEDVNIDKSILTKRLQDLEMLLTVHEAGKQQSGMMAAAASNTAVNKQQQTLASRLITLSEESRLAKLNAVQTRRKMVNMREEMKHLRSTIAQLERENAELEKMKIDVESGKLLLQQADQMLLGASSKQAQQQQHQSNSLLDDLFRMDDAAFGGGMAAGKGAASSSSKGGAGMLGSSSTRLSIDTDKNDDEDGRENLAKQKEKLSKQREELQGLRKEVSNFTTKQSSLEDKLEDYATSVDELSEQVQYYEQVLQQHGLEAIILQYQQALAAHHTAATPSKRTGSKQANSSSSHRAAGGHTLQPEEQEKIQQAATATISSLKSLLEEKNRLLESYREKVERLMNDPAYYHSHKSRVEKKADALLDALDATAAGSHSARSGAGKGGEHALHDKAMATLGGGGGGAGGSGALSEANKKLLEQIDTADSIITEKDRMINNLENKCMIASNQCERAELRCSESIQEMEAMKADMMTLLGQLQESEQKLAHALLLTHQNHHTTVTNMQQQQPAMMMMMTMQMQQQLAGAGVAGAADGAGGAIGQSTMRFKELEKLSKQKEEKVKKYREIIIRLKEEFIKSEEEKAIATAAAAAASSGKGGGGGNMSAQELQDLKANMANLRDGLHQARHDLEKAKKTRERLLQEKANQQEDLVKYQAQNVKLETQLAYANKTADRMTKEVQMMRMEREKMREKQREKNTTAAANNAAGGGGDNASVGSGHYSKLTGKETMPKLRERVEILERENELLKAQIAAVMKTGDGPAGHGGHGSSSSSLIRPSITGGPGAAGGPGQQREESKSANASPSRMGSMRSMTGGYLLGTGDGPPADDDLKQQLHHKWENEKKLQKRVATLENRINELVTDNDELREQLLKGKDTLTHAQQQAQEMSKKLTSSNKHVQDSRKMTITDLTELEQARKKVYELEEVNQNLLRKAEVDQVNQIRQLNHQLSTAHHRIRAMELEYGEQEERRKKTAASSGSSGGNNRLRESEDRFLQTERLKDELEFTRRQRLELEAALLDRDAKSLEDRFTMETMKSNLTRYERRMKEVEENNRQLTAIVNTMKEGGGGGGSGMGAGGVGSLPFNRDELNRQAMKSTSKREQELETVIDSLKRVIEKLKMDNERLRKTSSSGASSGAGQGAGQGAGGHEERKVSTPGGSSHPSHQPNAAAAGAGGANYEKRYQAEKRKTEKLEEEIQLLQNKAKLYEESGQKIAQRQQLITSLRKQLKDKEDDLKRYQSDSEKMLVEKDTLKKRVVELTDRLREVEILLAQKDGKRAGSAGADSRAGSEGGQQQWYQKVTELSTENDVLQLEIHDLRKRLEAAYHSGAGTGGKAAVGGQGAANSSSEYQALKQENDKLRQELSAFDLDFFEEIENLKYAHAEAIRKLRIYEAGGNPAQMMSGSGSGGGDRDRGAGNRYR